MKKRLSQRIGLLDLGRLPVTPVENKSGYESRTDFYAREKREAEERAMAPVLAVQAETEKAMRKLNKYIAQKWSASILELLDALNSKDPAAVDSLLPVEQGPCTKEAAQSAGAKWEQNFASSPYAFIGDGHKRMILYVLFAIANGYKMDTVEAFQAAFDRLLALNAFAPDELTYDQSKAPAETTPAKKLSEREQLENDMWMEAAPLYRAWLDSLYSGFKGFVPQQADLEYLFGTDTNSRDPQKRGWIWRSNLSPLSHQTYDKARRHMVATGRWPESLLTEDEKFAQQLEKMPVALDRLPHDDRFTLISNLDRLRR